MNHKIERRAALRPIAALSAAVVIPGWLLACSKKPDCNDVSKLSAEDLHTRNDVAKYVDQTLEAARRCSGCVQFVAAAPNQNRQRTDQPRWRLHAIRSQTELTRREPYQRRICELSICAGAFAST